MIKVNIIVIVFSMCVSGFAQRVKIPNQHAQSFVRFTENKKQWDSNIKFKAELDGGALFIEQNAKLTFHLYDKDNFRSRHLGKIISPKLKYHAYTVDFIGANALPHIDAIGAYDDYVNYFIGSNSIFY